jgi:hypothetical protein
VTTVLALIALAVLNPSIQDGHAVSYKLEPGSIKYRMRGQVFTTYVGGIRAPGSRQCEIGGTLELVTEPRGDKWAVVAKSGGLSVTKSGKPAPAAETKLALQGVWTQLVDGPATYTLNGKPAKPSQLNAPIWPISWAPISSPTGLKIGDELVREFQLPVQAFLEDDPVGVVPISLKAVFNGPEYPSSSRLYLFTIRADETFERPAKHPEDPTLNLKGHVLVDARLKVNRDTGRLESASLVMSVEFTLEGKKYPFGFSRAKGSVSANLERIK